MGQILDFIVEWGWVIMALFVIIGAVLTYFYIYPEVTPEDLDPVINISNETIIFEEEVVVLTTKNSTSQRVIQAGMICECHIPEENYVNISKEEFQKFIDGVSK